jgi:hypothetical protein
MAIKIPRSLPRLLLWSLILYAYCCHEGWAEWPFDVSISREFALFLFYAGPTLLVIGIVLVGLFVLFHVAVKQAPVPARDANALAKAIGTAIANSLTRYQAKHPSTPQRNTLTLTLADFESALLHKLPEEAYQQPSWWTDVSAHSQQWLKQGWQVIDTKLTDTSPHIVFSFNLLLTEEILTT